jgi:hypothetical protein
MGNFLDCIAAREYIPLKKKSTKTKAKISARSLSKENILQAIEHAMNQPISKSTSPVVGFFHP